MILPEFQTSFKSNDIMITYEEYLTPHQRNPEDFEYNVSKAEIKYLIELSLVSSGISEIILSLISGILFLEEKEVDDEGNEVNVILKEIDLKEYSVHFVKTTEHAQFIPTFLEVDFKNKIVDISY